MNKKHIKCTCTWMANKQNAYASGHYSNSSLGICVALCLLCHNTADSFKKKKEKSSISKMGLNFLLSQL